MHYILALVLLCSSPAFAGVYLGIDGAYGKSHLGLLTKETGSIGGSITIDLGANLRLGFKHKQEQSVTKGYVEDDASPNTYHTYREKMQVVANAGNLILVLYNGEVFTPYIFAGFALKMYQIEVEKDGLVSTTSITVPGPNGGVGLLIRMSQRFSLKATHTLSIGVQQDAVTGKSEQTLDSETDVGIQYSF